MSHENKPHEEDQSDAAAPSGEVPDDAEGRAGAVSEEELDAWTEGAVDQLQLTEPVPGEGEAPASAALSAESADQTENAAPAVTVPMGGAYAGTMFDPAASNVVSPHTQTSDNVITVVPGAMPVPAALAGGADHSDPELADALEGRQTDAALLPQVPTSDDQPSDDGAANTGRWQLSQLRSNDAASAKSPPPVPAPRMGSSGPAPEPSRGKAAPPLGAPIVSQETRTPTGPAVRGSRPPPLPAALRRDREAPAEREETGISPLPLPMLTSGARPGVGAVRKGQPDNGAASMPGSVRADRMSLTARIKQAAKAKMEFPAGGFYGLSTFVAFTMSAAAFGGYYAAKRNEALLEDITLLRKERQEVRIEREESARLLDEYGRRLADLEQARAVPPKPVIQSFAPPKKYQEVRLGPGETTLVFNAAGHEATINSVTCISDDDKNVKMPYYVKGGQKIGCRKPGTLSQKNLGSYQVAARGKEYYLNQQMRGVAIDACQDRTAAPTVPTHVELQPSGQLIAICMAMK